MILAISLEKESIKSKSNIPKESLIGLKKKYPFSKREKG